MVEEKLNELMRPSSDDPRMAFSQIHVGSGRESSGKASHWPMRSEFVAHINQAFLDGRRTDQIETLLVRSKARQLLDIEEAKELLRYKYPDLYEAVDQCYIHEVTIPELAELKHVTPQAISYRKIKGLQLLTLWTTGKDNRDARKEKAGQGGCGSSEDISARTEATQQEEKEVGMHEDT